MNDKYNKEKSREIINANLSELVFLNKIKQVLIFFFSGEYWASPAQVVPDITVSDYSRESKVESEADTKIATGINPLKLLLLYSQL